MKTATLSLFLSVACGSAVEPKQDLLSFKNGDQLHGKLSGIAEDSSLLWSRGDTDGAVKFKSSDVRRVALRGGRPIKSLAGLSHIGISNGDRIPGKIRAIDDKMVVIDTEYGGVLQFPRDQVGLLAPTPLGGRVVYQGPFDSDDWLLIDQKHPNGIPAVPAEGEKEDGIPRWNFSGSAWYWQNKDLGTALTMKTGMPDQAVFRFDISWKNRLSVAIAFHSDFNRPELIKEDVGDEARRAGMMNAGQNVSLPSLFGSSYVLHLYSNYLMLYRTSFDEEGRPRYDRVQAMNGNLRLGDSGKATVEIRCNRLSGEILLYVDGEFAAQWSEPGEMEGYSGKGEGFGFVSQMENSSVRISDIVVAEWNGMPDSARSMEVDDADIVLLANGTDRFSGKVIGMENGLLKLEGRFGNFEFPIDDIAEVRFAKSKIKEVEKVSGDRVSLRLHPLGRITGRLLGGDENTLRIGDTAAGEIKMSLDSAVMLEFSETGGFSYDWDDEF